MGTYKHPISTFTRIMYLNFWALFLLFLGAGVALLPLYRFGTAALVVQVLAVALIEKGALNIFRTWGDKKRKYNVLTERNRNAFRPDTFEEYMQAPCGRLLVKVVLADLGMPERYASLKRMKRGFWTCRKDRFRTENARIWINPDYSPDAVAMKNTEKNDGGGKKVLQN